MRYWLEYIPFIIVAGLVRLLPRKLALAFGRGLGNFARHLQKKRVRIADDNLRHAFPEKTAEERSRLVKRVFRDLGQGFIEMLRLDMFNGQEDLQKLFRIEGQEHLREALGQGRGCILLTGHVGFWEAGAFIFPMLGIPIDMVAKPMKNPHVDRYFRRMRQAYGSRIIDSRGGARRIFKVLQDNRLVGILMDQHMPRSKAVRVPFFGRPAYTTPIIAQIAMKYRVPVLPAFAYRERDDTYRIIIERSFLLDDEMSDANIVANTAILTAKIEAGIRRDVGQWFWVHRRWKHVSGNDI